MKKFFFSFLAVFLFLLINTMVIYAQDYYVSNSGDDNNSGLSEYSPWRTISKVNNFNFKPGDVIHFKKGDVWREQLVPRSGNENGSITYTSYGFGNKPLFLGSVDRSYVDHWKEVGHNIWSFSTKEYDLWSIPTIPADNVSFWKEEGVDSSYNVLNNEQGKKCIRIKCDNAGESIYDIMVSLKGLKIKNGKNYTFSFRAKSNITFKIPFVILMKDNFPWTDCSSTYTDAFPVISTEWSYYRVSYQANVSDDNARVTMYLGKDLPSGAELYIDHIRFFEADPLEVYEDVGNIIFNDGEIFGTKIFSPEELDEQNEFYYDEESHNVRMYSLDNPGKLYSTIECALTKNIIQQIDRAYITYDGLALKYGSAHGIGGGNTHHINILNCDISFIGGGKLREQTRYGNGIEFWNNAHDNLVEGCYIWQIYDSAVTIQGIGNNNKQYNISFRNNQIWNSQWSFEFWLHNETSIMGKIYFEGNTCKNAGFGWGSEQRTDDTGGIHLCLFDSTSEISSKIVIRNNIFLNAEEMSFYLSPRWNGFENLELSNNIYIQPENKIVVSWRYKRYYSDDFMRYKKEAKSDKLSVLLSCKNRADGDAIFNFVKINPIEDIVKRIVRIKSFLVR